MEKQKKYLLIFAIAIATFILTIENIGAVTFNGSDTPSLPTTVLSGSDLYLQGYTNTNPGYFAGLLMGTNEYIISRIDALVIDDSFKSFSGIFLDQEWLRNNSYSQSIGGAISLKYHKSGYGSDVEFGVYTSNGASATTEIINGIVHDVYENISCNGLSPDCVLVFAPTFYVSTTGVYLSWIDVYFYYNSANYTKFKRADFTAVYGGNGLALSSYNWFNYGMSPNYGYLSGVVYYKQYQYNTDSNLAIALDFLTNASTGSYQTLYPSMPEYLGSTGTIFIPSQAGSGSTGSGFSDYFDYSSCTSFLDVGCYIQQTMYGLGGFISSLFPDISFSGSSQTCMSGSTGATSTISGSVSYVQKLVNFAMIIIPVAPPNGTIVCTIGGFTGTVSYQSLIPSQYRHNMPNNLSIVDILLMSLIAFALFDFIRNHHRQSSGGGESISYKYNVK